MSTYLAFIKAHERLLIVLASLAVIFMLSSKALSVWDTHDSKKVVATQTQLVVDTKATDALQSQLSALSAQLSAQTAALQSKLATQLKTDQTLTSAAAATRLGGTPVDASTVELPLTTARADIAQLDTLPVVQAELDGETKLAATQSDLITSLHTEISDQTKACAAQVADLKVKSKRSFLRGLKYGFVAGFVAGAFVVHSL
jgi:hypothetical protein